MDQNKTVKGILDSLMKTDKLKRFVTEQDDEGNTYVKMKFVPKLGDNQKSSESSGSSENINSDVHLYRKSDTRFNRDITRTKGPKLRPNACATDQTPSNQSIVIENKSESTELSSSVPAAATETAAHNLSSEQIMKSDTTKPPSSETSVEKSDISSSVKSSVKPSMGVVTRSSGKKTSDTKTATAAVIPVGGAGDCLAAPTNAQVNSVPQVKVKQRPTQKPAEWIVHAYDSYMSVSKVQMHTYFCDECNLKPKDAVSQGIKIAFCNTRGCDLGCTKDTCYCICEKCFNDSSHNKMGTPCYVTMIKFPNVT